MTTPKKKTTAQEIIERIGNYFHSRLVNKLRELEWGALVSPHYNDNFTDKLREIDIIAEKKFDVFMNDWFGTLNFLDSVIAHEWLIGYAYSFIAAPVSLPLTITQT